MCLVGNHPSPPPALAIGDFVVDVPLDPEVTKPVKIEEVEVQTNTGADVPIQDPNQGGPTETSTIAHPPTSPAGVMAGSVLAQANSDMGDMLGNDVDPNASNMIDVILAGKGGMRGANATGKAGDGDNRMEGIGGAGLGVGGRSGFGTGRGSIEGTMRTGINSHGPNGVATRGIVLPPRPTDLELGGEAGSRSPESILRVIRTHVGGFRYTYEKALKERPDLGGKISLRFTIAPSGDITAIEVVSSSTGDAALDDQIKDKAKRMKFDQIENGNVTVTYAFVLDRQ
jgi:TonB family protein